METNFIDEASMRPSARNAARASRRTAALLVIVTISVSSGGTTPAAPALVGHTQSGVPLPVYPVDLQMDPVPAHRNGGVAIEAALSRKLAGDGRFCVTLSRTTRSIDTVRNTYATGCSDELPSALKHAFDPRSHRYTVSGSMTIQAVVETHRRTRYGWRRVASSGAQRVTATLDFSWAARGSIQAQPPSHVGICYWLLLVCFGSWGSTTAPASVDGRVGVRSLAIDEGVRGQSGTIRYYG